MLYTGGITHKKDRPQPSPRLDAFAELLAEGATPAGAAIKMGLHPGTGSKMLTRLRQRLGPQAR